RLEGNGTLEAPLARDPDAPQRMAVRADGKHAVTHYDVLAHAPGRTLLRVRLETGRNHQIRVHLAHTGHPVCGDPVYGTPEAGMRLHAWKLGFTHPVTGEPLRFEEPPPWPTA
ncbi:MAG TPA: pseudouridine synthase, partial [Oscillatoriaceae cyanobacterium]